MGVKFINHYPKLRVCVIVIVRKLGLFPTARSIYKRFTGIYHQNNSNLLTIQNANQLSPHARQIYVSLKAAIRNNKRGNC